MFSAVQQQNRPACWPFVVCYYLEFHTQGKRGREMKNLFLAALTAAGLLVSVLHHFPSSSAQISASTPVQLEGLRAPVKIRRDERGIPYIEAANDDDLYFAQGYVTAGDRLWQMDLLRRTVRGELSEIFGQATLT